MTTRPSPVQISMKALWLPSLTGVVVGLANAVPEWLGLTGPATFLSRAHGSAEGSALPIVASISLLRVLFDLMQIAWLGLIGFATTLSGAIGRDAMERYGAAQVPFVILALLSLTLGLLAPDLAKLLAPDVWTLVSAACSGFVAAFCLDRSAHRQKLDTM